MLMAGPNSTPLSLSELWSASGLTHPCKEGWERAAAEAHEYCSNTAENKARCLTATQRGKVKFGFGEEERWGKGIERENWR